MSRIAVDLNMNASEIEDHTVHKILKQIVRFRLNIAVYQLLFRLLADIGTDIIAAHFQRAMAPVDRYVSWIHVHALKLRRSHSMIHMTMGQQNLQILICQAADQRFEIPHTQAGIDQNSICLPFHQIQQLPRKAADHGQIVVYLFCLIIIHVLLLPANILFF